MKFFTGWIMFAGLVVSATAATAQMPARYPIGTPYMAASDVAGPYAAMPPEAPPPSYGYGYGPMLLPPGEVYAIVRDSGFSPLGIPRQRGLFYTIAVIDRRGDDGRLVIDARSGRIVRFMPAYRMDDNFNDGPAVRVAPVGPLSPMGDQSRSAPRPPASLPRVASRTPPVPLPKASPSRAGESRPETMPLAAKPAPAQQSAAVQAKPADVPAAPKIVEARPAAPTILPTQEMPKAQGLD